MSRSSKVAVTRSRAASRRAAASADGDRKSTRLNSSHDQISYAVFCLKKKKRTLTNLHTSTSKTVIPNRLAICSCTDRQLAHTSDSILSYATPYFRCPSYVGRDN